MCHSTLKNRKGKGYVSRVFFSVEIKHRDYIFIPDVIGEVSNSACSCFYHLEVMKQSEIRRVADPVQTYRDSCDFVYESQSVSLMLIIIT